MNALELVDNRGGGAPPRDPPKRRGGGYDDLYHQAMQRHHNYYMREYYLGHIPSGDINEANVVLAIQRELEGEVEPFRVPVPHEYNEEMS